MLFEFDTSQNSLNSFSPIEGKVHTGWLQRKSNWIWRNESRMGLRKSCYLMYRYTNKFSLNILNYVQGTFNWDLSGVFSSLHMKGNSDNFFHKNFTFIECIW
jgi:hypothetical protein